MIAAMRKLLTAIYGVARHRRLFVYRIADPAADQAPAGVCASSH